MCVSKRTAQKNLRLPEGADVAFDKWCSQRGLEPFRVFLAGWMVIHGLRPDEREAMMMGVDRFVESGFMDAAAPTPQGVDASERSPARKSTKRTGT